jgi:hypothetical protein
VQVREWGCERLRIERRPNRSGDATAQVRRLKDELDGELRGAGLAGVAPEEL